MKTAISIPDKVFETAEGLARRLHLSRSELYVRAIKEYVQEHCADGVKESLDQVYGTTDSALDEVSKQLQSESLPEDDW